MKNKHTITALIVKHLPSFCWQTWDEILTMLEQIDEDIDAFCLRATLSKLKKRGIIIGRALPKKTGKKGPRPYEYVRATA